MRGTFRLGSVWLLLVLAGCQGNPSRTGYYASPLLPGDEVEILKDLVVPIDMARVYLQDGKTTSYGGTNQYAPFCYFLLRDPMPVAQTIRPGVRIVQRVWLDQTTVSLEVPLRLASAFGLGVGDHPLMAWQFHITLGAEDQSRMTLVCSGAFDDPSMADPIRLPEVRQALGDYAEIRVKGAPQSQ